MILELLGVVIVILGFAYWLGQLFLAVRLVRSVPTVEKLPAGEMENWPKVSVVIPARNEIDTIEQAMQSRLKEDYPNVEFIIVDDRSTDGTSDVVERIAQKDSRVKPIHISELPEGWIGKLYAMDFAVRNSSGEWLLFSDADVYIKPGTLKRTIAYAVKRKLDHVALIPELWAKSFFLNVVFSMFMRMICLGIRLWQVENDKSKVSAGSGSFNLVRKSAFDKINGFQKLKLEIADDVALGQVLKGSGARCSILNGRGYVGVFFYPSIASMSHAAERGGFTSLGNFSFVRILSMSILLVVLEVSPFFAFFSISALYLWPIAIASLFSAICTSIIISLWTNRPLIYSFFFPLGSIIMGILLVRAGILGALRGGIYWRGTFYPTKIIRKGKVFRI